MDGGETISSKSDNTLQAAKEVAGGLRLDSHTRNAVVISRNR